MILSPAERSYLYDSLSLQPIIRPDSRSESQFRPLEASCSFLPNSNGSSRLRLADGSEVIISIKSKVVKHDLENSLIAIDLDINGIRDDSNQIKNLISSLNSLLLQNFPMHNLKLSDKYSFKIFIDIVVILSHTSFPLTLISLATYLALKSTKLPLLTSTTNDREIEEQPTFDDDWESSNFLFDPAASTIKNPPLIFVVGLVGENVFIDPSAEEEEVTENAFIIGYHDGKIISPVQNLNLTSKNIKGFNAKHLLKAQKLVLKCGLQVSEALNTIAKDDDFKTIF